MDNWLLVWLFQRMPLFIWINQYYHLKPVGTGFLPKGRGQVLFRKALQLREQKKELKRLDRKQSTSTSHPTRQRLDSTELAHLPILDALLIQMTRRFPEGAWSTTLNGCLAVSFHGIQTSRYSIQPSVLMARVKADNVGEVFAKKKARHFPGLFLMVGVSEKGDISMVLQWDHSRDMTLLSVGYGFICLGSQAVAIATSLKCDE